MNKKTRSQNNKARAARAAGSASRIIAKLAQCNREFAASKAAVEGRAEAQLRAANIGACSDDAEAFMQEIRNANIVI